MPPIVKDSDVPSTASESSAARSSTTNARPDETANRPQPVALEVPVTVNGARTVEGSDKREPFSESTKTVLIFGNGAVIRLSSPVTAGQLLFLTNEKTKKEVVCQVVKSKNYRNVSGYVELEFTEPVVGFWGMRFPGDRLAAPPAVSGIPPAASPSTPKVLAPGVSVAPRTRDVTPAPTPLAAKPSIPPVNAIPTASKTPAPIIPVVPAAIQQDPVATSGESSSEALKLQTARLQEQLSSMLFSGAASSQPPQPPVSTTQDRLEASEAAAKIFEMAKAEPAEVRPAPPAKVSQSSAKTSLDTEEVKIPAWLEPLARNAAAPASTQELIEREKAKLAAQRIEGEEEAVALPFAPVQETESSVQAEEPAFGSRYSHEEESIGQTGVSGGSKKGMWIGLAAAAILAAGAGGWYFSRLSSPTQQTSAAVTTPATTAGQQPQTVAQSVIPAPPAPVSNSNPNLTNPTKPGGNSTLSNSPAPNTTAPSTIASTEKVNPKPSPNTRDTTRDTSKEGVRTIPTAETERVKQPAEPEPKKPVLGEVHLATPKVNRSTTQNGVAEPSLSATDSSANGAALGSGLEITDSKQPAAPAAPLPVGGDVKPAKLASSVSPIYPALARSQHVSGDVKIDALIDATGRVTTMKVISGPTLLHQAAMDALRQWKYQPATLDGNPVPMHLTVTLQFRLQ